jgi:hypothetical protein
MGMHVLTRNMQLTGTAEAGRATLLAAGSGVTLSDRSWQTLTAAELAEVEREVG